MNQLTDEHVAIDVALSKTRYVPRHLRLLAVKVELKERVKPKRDMTQEAVARLFGVTERMLRYWVERYLAKGVKGLRAGGGQGRKRDVSKEDVAKAVRDSIESSMEEGGGGGGEKPTCRACLAEDADGGGASRREGKRRAQPKKCKCRGRRAVTGKCRCRQGRVCKCKCCRLSSTRRRARGTTPAARARGPGREELRGPPPCTILYTPGTARCTTCTTCMRSSARAARRTQDLKVRVKPRLGRGGVVVGVAPGRAL